MSEPKKTDEQPATVQQAIAAVMRALGEQGISKSGTNKEQGYKFRAIEDVLAACNKAMTAAGLVVVPEAKERHVEHLPARSGQMTYVSIRVEYTLIGPDGSSVTAAYWGEGADKGDKATSKAQTNAFKYLVITMFCVPLEGMLDGDQDTPDRDRVTDEYNRDQLAAHRAREQARDRLLATGAKKGLDADGVIAWCQQQYNAHPKDAGVQDLVAAEAELAKAMPDKPKPEQNGRPRGSENHPSGRRQQGRPPQQRNGEQQGKAQGPGIPGQRGTDSGS